MSPRLGPEPVTKVQVLSDLPPPLRHQPPYKKPFGGGGSVTFLSSGLGLAASIFFHVGPLSANLLNFKPCLDLSKAAASFPLKLYPACGDPGLLRLPCTSQAPHTGGKGMGLDCQELSGCQTCAKHLLAHRLLAMTPRDGYSSHGYCWVQMGTVPVLTSHEKSQTLSGPRC